MLGNVSKYSITGSVCCLFCVQLVQKTELSLDDIMVWSDLMIGNKNKKSDVTEKLASKSIEEAEVSTETRIFW